MVLDPIPQSLPVHFFGSRPQPPTSPVYGGYAACQDYIVEFQRWTGGRAIFAKAPRQKVRGNLSNIASVYGRYVRCDISQIAICRYGKV